MDMSKEEFFIYSIKEKLYTKLNWYKSVFTNQVEGKFIVSKYKDGFKYNDIFIIADNSKPLFSLYDKVKIPKNTLKCKPQEFADTIGAVTLNALIIDLALQNQISYFEEQFSYSDIEETVKDILIKNKFTPSELRKMFRAFILIRNLAKVLVLPITEKVYDPPSWLPKYREEMIKKYSNQYGKDWYKDDALVLKWETEIMNKVKEYFKDDPTYNITTDKKALKSFKKKYISIGLADRLTSDTEVKPILYPLTDEWKIDKDDMTAINNTIIYGSNARARLTVIAGTFSKYLITAVQGIKIAIDDCKTTDGFPIIITKNMIKPLTPLYRVEGKKSIKNDEEFLKKNIGKTIVIRLPMYCKAKKDTLCRMCIGAYASLNDNASALIASATGGDYLNYNLSKFHSVDKEVREYTFDDLK